jgi:hypothetical protein
LIKLAFLRKEEEKKKINVARKGGQSKSKRGKRIYK